MKAKLIEAFGESKTVRDWAKDDRCVLDYETLRGRLKSGKFSNEEAITTPILKSRPGGDLKIGDEIHRFIIRDKFMKQHYGQNATYVIVDCMCGTKGIELPLRRILDGNTRSCGCLQTEVQRERAIERNYKHGKGNLEYRLYKIWCNMKARCYTSSSTQFENYGGRGIKVDDGWREDFEKFEKWSLENGYNDNLSLDRINNNGNYEPFNCRWISLASQQKNKRSNVNITAWGETKILADWVKDKRAKAGSQTIWRRIRSGQDPETAISTKTSNKKGAMVENRLNKIWKTMISRCYNPKSTGYKYWGGKGIKICNEWLNFTIFELWSINNNYDNNLTIDRIDSNKNYCPENCRWVTQSEQNRNTGRNVYITAWNETKTLSEWKRDFRFGGSNTIRYRIKNGWGAENAISTPPKRRFT